MIAQRQRFHGHNSLRTVYLQGKQIRGQAISLKYLQGSPQRPYRAAVVVSRKVHKSAVVRNRIRRRIYEIIRTLPTAQQPGSDMVFTVFDVGLATVKSSQLRLTIDRLLNQRQLTTEHRSDVL